MESDWSMLAVSACAFAFDGRGGLWVLSPAGTLRRLDLGRGEVARRHARVEGASGVTAMAVDAAGERVALCDADGLRVLEAALAGGEVVELPMARMATAAWSPDGGLLALADVEHGALVMRVDGLEVLWDVTYEGAVTRPRVRFDAAGERLAVMNGERVTLHAVDGGAEVGEVTLAQRPVSDHASDPTLSFWALVAYVGQEVYLVEPVEGVTRPMMSRCLNPAPVTALACAPPAGVWVATTRGELCAVEPRLETLFAHPGGAVAREVALSPGGGHHLVSLWSDDVARLHRLAPTGA